MFKISVTSIHDSWASTRDSLLIAFSSKLFKSGKKGYILPESFFSRVHNDISLEKSILGSCGDIDCCSVLF